VIFCVPVDQRGFVGGGWGRAQAVALASVDAAGQIDSWEVHEVGWGDLHGVGGEGAHHARIVRFLRHHQVGCVVVEHMGPGMRRVMAAMKIPTFTGAQGAARACVEQAAAVLAAQDAPTGEPRSPALEVGALLVDMDGTLVDSSAAVAQVWTEYAQARGLDPAAVLGHAHGRRPNETIARFDPADPDPAATAQRLQAQEMSLTQALRAAPGAADLWHGIGGGSPDAKVALVTSASRPLAEVRMAAAGLALPAVAICAEDVAAGKPAPDGYLAAARRLGVGIEDCLVLEDSPAGVAAALASGAKLAVVGGGAGQPEDPAQVAVMADLTGLTAKALASGRIEVAFG
jgi:sugar-phosphatase